MNEAGAWPLFSINFHLIKYSNCRQFIELNETICFFSNLKLTKWYKMCNKLTCTLVIFLQVNEPIHIFELNRNFLFIIFFHSWSNLLNGVSFYSFIICIWYFLIAVIRQWVFSVEFVLFLVFFGEGHIWC